MSENKVKCDCGALVLQKNMLVHQATKKHVKTMYMLKDGTLSMSVGGGVGGPSGVGGSSYEIPHTTTPQSRVPTPGPVKLKKSKQVDYDDNNRVEDDDDDNKPATKRDLKDLFDALVQILEDQDIDEQDEQDELLQHEHKQ